MGIEFRPDSVGKSQHNIPITGTQFPGRLHPRSRQGCNVHVTVAGTDIDHLQAAFETYVPVSGVRAQRSRQSVTRDVAVAGMEADFPVGRTNIDVSVTCIGAQRPFDSMS